MRNHVDQRKRSLCIVPQRDREQCEKAGGRFLAGTVRLVVWLSSVSWASVLALACSGMWAACGGPLDGK